MLVVKITSFKNRQVYLCHKHLQLAPPPELALLRPCAVSQMEMLDLKRALHLWCYYTDLTSVLKEQFKPTQMWSVIEDVGCQDGCVELPKACVGGSAGLW